MPRRITVNGIAVECWMSPTGWIHALVGGVEIGSFVTSEQMAEAVALAVDEHRYASRLPHPMP